MNDRVSLPAMWALALALSLLSMFVSVAHAGDATLTWTPPTESVDGKALTNLASYRIYYGTSDAILDRNVLIANPGVTTFKIDNLTPATWYFAMTATLASGETSDFSPKVLKTITDVAIPPPPQLVTTGPYSYTLGGTITAPTMSAIGLIVNGLPCGTATKTIGAVKFCQITRTQTDLIGWPVDKTLASGVWAKAQ